MEALALLAIGSLALWMVVAIVGAQLLRRRRRRDMGLDVDVGGEDGGTQAASHAAHTPSRPAADVSARLPRREKDWREDAPDWSRPNYYGSTRRRP